MVITLATWITLLRFVFAFGLIVDYYAGWRMLVVWWSLAVFSDFLDGFLARYYSMQSSLGALLDPLADKSLAVAAFYVLLMQHFSWYLFMPCLVILVRDIWISLLRIRRYSYHGDVGDTGVTWLSQCKTATLMLAQFLLLCSVEFPDGLVYWCGFVLIYATAMVSIYTIAGFLQSSDAPVYT